MTADRPSRSDGLEVEEVPGGLLIYKTGDDVRIHLNSTAAVVFELCRGEHTADEIAAELAREFGLETPPTDLVRGCVAQLREQDIIRAPKATEPGELTADRPIRVLAFTCSRDRPVLLRHCILQMKAQTYPVDHSVYLNGSHDNRSLYDDLPGDHLLLQFGPRLAQHLNYLAAVNAVRLEDYDLFCKIDDDDVYRTDYIAGVVADFRRYGWDYSGSHSEGWIRGTQWLNDADLAGFGPHSDFDLGLGVIYIMPPTAAFSRRAIECISGLDLASPPEELRLGNAFEDVAWGRIIARAGLATRVRSTSRFTYHVHGANISTAGMMGPGHK